MPHTKINRLFLAGIASVFCQVALALPGHPYVSAAIATSSAKVKSDSQINYYQGELTDSFPLSHQQNTRPVLSLNGGYEWSGQGIKPAIALGLGIYRTTHDYHYTGQVTETALGDPSFVLYNYGYQIQNSHLMVEAQLTWKIFKFISFINVGIGPSWNRFNSYTESPATSDGYVVYPPFQSNTMTQFASQAGVGIGYQFDYRNTLSSSSGRIAIGYRYANLGNVKSGIRNADYPFNLSLGNLITNSLYLSYTHLF